jgi:hypothetical protein
MARGSPIAARNTNSECWSIARNAVRIVGLSAGAGAAAVAIATADAGVGAAATAKGFPSPNVTCLRALASASVWSSRRCCGARGSGSGGSGGGSGSGGGGADGVLRVLRFYVAATRGRCGSENVGGTAANAVARAVRCEQAVTPHSGGLTAPPSLAGTNSRFASPTSRVAVTGLLHRLTRCPPLTRAPAPEPVESVRAQWRPGQWLTIQRQRRRAKPTRGMSPQPHTPAHFRDHSRACTRGRERENHHRRDERAASSSVPPPPVP